MKYGNLLRSKARACGIVLSLSMAVTGPAAATDLFGGGATLPAGAYVGFGFIGGVHSHVLSSNTLTQFAGQDPSGVDAGSLFGAWAAASGNKVSYCQTGSGNGKKIFNNYDGFIPVSSSHMLTSVGLCDGTASGFAAPTGVAVDPHFVGSGVPMSPAEYAAFNTGGKQTKYGQPSQFPVLAGSIAIVYNNADVTTRLNLTDAQICGVMKHTITDWHTLSANLPSKAIKVIYRSDGSGTTFSLANHLIAACGNNMGSARLVFDEMFTTVVGEFGVPANWKGVNGNGIITEMNLQSEDGSISYDESANLKAAAAEGIAPNVAYATVNGKDPFADFPDTISFFIVTNVVLGTNPVTKAPIVVPMTPNIIGTSCIYDMAPSVYANVTNRYPIMGISYIVTNYRGNGSAAPALQGLISSAYGVSTGGVVTHPGVTTVGAGTGFAFVASTTAIDVNSCVNI